MRCETSLAVRALESALRLNPWSATVTSLATLGERLRSRLTETRQEESNMLGSKASSTIRSRPMKVLPLSCAQQDLNTEARQHLCAVRVDTNRNALQICWQR